MLIRLWDPSRDAIPRTVRHPRKRPRWRASHGVIHEMLLMRGKCDEAPNGGGAVYTAGGAFLDAEATDGGRWCLALRDRKTVSVEAVATGGVR